MAQTAMKALIEWAISLKDKEQQCIDWICIKSKIEELLPMEKQQIINAFRVGDDCGHRFALTEDTQQFNSGEQYYNETYNK